MIVTLDQLIGWGACGPARLLFREEFGEHADTATVTPETAAKFDLDWLARYIFNADQTLDYLDEKEEPLDDLEIAYERIRKMRRSDEIKAAEASERRQAAIDAFKLARARAFLTVANRGKNHYYDLDDEEPDELPEDMEQP